MWIVKVALHRPYTFVVVAILILLLGVSAVATMPTADHRVINLLGNEKFDRVEQKESGLARPRRPHKDSRRASDRSCSPAS